MDAPSANPAAATPAAADTAGNGAPAWQPDPDLEPDLSNLVTEDDTPVESIFADMQQRLLTHTLYSSWRPEGAGRSFLALSNVGYFYSNRQPALVPDMLLSLDVAPAGPLETKEGHSYFQWLMAKPPDVIIEIVSDKTGGEETHKMKTYSRQGVRYYAIFDPKEVLNHGVLRVFRLRDDGFKRMKTAWLPGVGLGLTLWEGTFEGVTRTWLRWCDRAGKVIPTGEERAEAERQRADAAEQRAEAAAAKLQEVAAKLRQLGVEPDV
jgi:Uma2 family endonuclease